MKQEETTTPVVDETTPEETMEIQTPTAPEINYEFLDGRPLSKTSLMEFRKSPAHYMYYLTAPKVVTPAYVLGGLIDCLVLTPELFERRYVVAPPINKMTKDGKAEWAKFKADNIGKTIITPDILQQASNVRDALLTNPKSSEYIHQMTTVQRQLKWEDKATGLPFIAYTDMDGTEPDLLGELKTTNDASPESFARDAFKFGYHIQMALYMEAFRRKLYRFPRPVFIVAEKEAPYGVAVYDKVDPAFLKLGTQEVTKLREAFLHCMKNKLFSQSYDFGTVDGGLILDLPGWAKQKLED